MKITNIKINIFLLLNIILTSCCAPTRIRSYIIAEKEHSLINTSSEKEISKESALNTNEIK